MIIEGKVRQVTGVCDTPATHMSRCVDADGERVEQPRPISTCVDLPRRFHTLPAARHRAPQEAGRPTVLDLDGSIKQRCRRRDTHGGATHRQLMTGSICRKPSGMKR